MTVGEIVQEVWEGLGEPSDLDPYGSDGVTVDTGSKGWLRLVRVVNTGCLALASWKWPNGRQVKMRAMEAVTYVRTAPLSRTVVAYESEVLTLSSGGCEEGMLVVGGTSGAKGVVFYADDEVVSIGKVSGTFEVGEAVAVYDRTVVLDAPAMEVVSVEDLATGLLLEEMSRRERTTTELVVGVPTQMYRVGRGFVMDVWPASGQEYAVRYVRGPVVVGAVGDVPELPVQFHQGLVLWGIWWGLRRAQESTDAYAVKKDLEDFMMRTMSEFDVASEGQVKLYPEGV